jgi:hypothetical protein
MRVKKIALAGLALLGATLLACSEKATTPQTTERWRVQHYKAPCMGEDVQLCYLVDRGTGQFEYWYDEIEALEYQWGFSYEILVRKRQRQPMADAAAFQYRLAGVSRREHAPAAATFRLAVSMNGAALIEERDGKCMLLGAISIDTSSQPCNLLRTRTAITFQHHAFEPMLVPIKDTP